MICPRRKVVYGEKLSRGCSGERLSWEKGAFLIVSNSNSARRRRRAVAERAGSENGRYCPVGLDRQMTMERGYI